MAASKRELIFRVWDGRRFHFARESFRAGWDSGGHPFLRCYLNSSPCSQALEIDQFVGLRDRDGKEIWEGDIVQEKWFAPCGEMEDCYVVKFGLYEDSDGFPSIGFYADHTLGAEVREMESGGNIYPQKENRRRVIGNVHQNPDLLK